MQNDMLQENIHLLTVQFQPITGSGARVSYNIINVCIGQIYCTREVNTERLLHNCLLRHTQTTATTTTNILVAVLARWDHFV